jgi:hypothetical protein
LSHCHWHRGLWQLLAIFIVAIFHLLSKGLPWAAPGWPSPCCSA